MNFRNMRGQIKSYRASGRMFGQTFNSGIKLHSLPKDAIECPCGYLLGATTDPCPAGHDYWNIPSNKKYNHDDT